MTTAYPLLIETHGKQDYIFGTGRRRESVGASHLIHALSAEWAPQAIMQVTGAPPGRLADGTAAEVLIDSSGTFLAFVTDEDHARQIVRTVTGRALRDAPGLGATGVVGDGFEWDSGHAPAAIRQVFDLMPLARVNHPATVARFPVLPVTALCPSSGLPVAGTARIGTDREPRSATSLAKLCAAEAAFERLAGITGHTPEHIRTSVRLLDGNHEDESERRAVRRVAVVHADGNGLGGLFASIHELITDRDDEHPDGQYAASYRRFSAALTLAAEDAFRAAVGELPVLWDTTPRVLPLVVGGDDLTFVAEASVAPLLVRRYMCLLVERLAADPMAGGLLRSLARKDRPGVGIGDPRIGVSAGMVVTTPHFPFTASYALADELVTEVAKRAKTELVDTGGDAVPCNAFAAHVQLDTSATTVEAALDGLTVGAAVLTAAPYVELVDVPGVDRELTEPARRWLRGRGTAELWSLCESVRRPADPDQAPRLPSGQLHELRARLRPDPGAANEYLRRLLAADRARWQSLVEDDDSLFTRRAGDDPSTTRLLDALVLAPFIPASTSDGQVVSGVD